MLVCDFCQLDRAPCFILIVARRLPETKTRSSNQHRLHVKSYASSYAENRCDEEQSLLLQHVTRTVIVSSARVLSYHVTTG